MSAAVMDVLQALAEDALAMTAPHRRKRVEASGPVVMRKARSLRPGGILLCRERTGSEKDGRVGTFERQVVSVRRTWDRGIVRVVVDGGAFPVHAVHANALMRVVAAREAAADAARLSPAATEPPPQPRDLPPW